MRDNDRKSALGASQKMDSGRMEKSNGQRSGAGKYLLGLLTVLALGLGVRAEEPAVFQDPSTVDGAAKVDVTARPKEKTVETKQSVPEPVKSNDGAETAPANAAKPAGSDSGETADKGKEKMVPVEAMLNPPTPEEELPLYNMVKEAIKSGAPGTRSELKKMKLTDISARSTALQALDRALTIQIQAHNNQFAHYAKEEAKAVFMPVFNLSPQYNNTNTWERKEEFTVAQKIQKQRVKFFKDVPGGVAPGDQPNILGQNFFKNGEIQFVDPKSLDHFYVLSETTDAFGTPVSQVIDQNLKTLTSTVVAEGGGVTDFLRNKKLGYIDPQKKARELPLVWNYNVASKRKRDDPRMSGPVSITQQLPWGPVLSVTVTEAYHDKPYDKFGHTWNRPWYTNFSTSLFLPLPGTKNFGPYAPQDTSIRIAKLAEKQSLYDLKAVINSTLLAADLRYLGLVNAYKNLEAVSSNRKTMETLAGATGKLLELARAPQYNKDQIDSEVMRVRVVEEAAWTSYVNASNSLVDLLALEPGTLLLPVGYSKTMNEHPAINIENALQVAETNRMELKSADTAIRTAEVFLRFFKQQSRPDISVSGSATWDQVQTPDSSRARGETGIGYINAQKSLANTFNSDTLFESYSFVFRRQFINRAEHARIYRAQAQLDQQRLTYDITKDSVDRDVNDALATLATARARVDAAKIRVESNRQGYDEMLKLLDIGKNTMFETVSKNQERLDAEFGLNIALVSYKAAETQLMFAQGTLPSEYPERIAPNEFNRYRLGLLKANNALQFFGDGKDKDAK
jgi:outer membrane protein TolC